MEISKRDADGNELKGAQMQLLDDKGTVVDEWTSDGTNHIVAKLSAGKYILKETAAPEGYILATDICFEVLNDGAETTAVSENGNPLIVMIDEAEQEETPEKYTPKTNDTAPKTGDSRNIRTAAVLMGLSGIGALLLAISMKKKRKDTEE